MSWKRSHLASAVRSLRPASATIHLEDLIPESERRLPIVTVHDASSHAMAWIGSVFGPRVLPIGVDRFGESGTIDELYESFGLLPDQIVNAAVAAVNLRG